MFDELIESAGGHRPSHRGWTVATSALAQTLALCVLMLIPLLRTQALPRAVLGGLLLVPPPQPAPPRPQAKPGGRKGRSAFKRQVINGRLTAPKFIPNNVLMLQESAELLLEAGGDGNVGSVFSNLLGEGGRALAGGKEKNAPPPPPVTMRRIRQGGVVQQSRLISQGKLAYPALAMQARVQGVVVLRAVIDADGGISELHAVSGHPLLIQAAIDGVRGWRYRPTLLNGEPVEVDTTITVTFTLAN